MWHVLSSAVAGWSRHRVATLGAALAYYSVFSLGPVLLIVTATAGLLFGEDAVRGELTGQFRSLLGPAGSQAVEAMLAGAASPRAGALAAIVGTILLLVAALAVVVQLKDDLNTIWEIDAATEAGWRAYLRTYLVSFAGILGLGPVLPRHRPPGASERDDQMTKLKLLAGVALLACAATNPASALPTVNAIESGKSAFLQQAAYRCYYRHGYRHCRYYSYDADYHDAPYYDYGWGPSIGFGFGGFGRGFHGHGGHGGHHP
jgi:hypothetical protein